MALHLENCGNRKQYVFIGGQSFKITNKILGNNGPMPANIGTLKTDNNITSATINLTL